MENFKSIYRSEVWEHLQSGKKVIAVILKSRAWRTGIKELWHDWSVSDINKLLSEKEKNIMFFEEIERSDNNS